MLSGGSTFQGPLTTPGGATTLPNLAGGVVKGLFFCEEPMRPIITFGSEVIFDAPGCCSETVKIIGMAIYG